MTELEIPFPMY